MIEYAKVKIVIWDLDETFWKGTFSEENIEVVSENIQLVRDLTDMGVINAICSKNDEKPIEEKLEQLNISDYFVFNSIDWTPKGPRIKKMLSDMGLRPANALFLDDNHLNLQEAKFFNEDIMLGGPEDIKDLIQFVNNSDKKDLQHSRLNQYKVLEKKNEERKNMGSNEEFLMSSDIRVSINTDCMNVIDRLAEMIKRTNQLNFTKNRMEKKDLIDLLKEKGVTSGYVTVKDRFGEYGIVGMYVIKEEKLVHFLFSCRTIGMGIEQYVYASIGYPSLEVVGEVIGEVNDSPAPKWINQDGNIANKSKASSHGASVLVKGPCDLKALFSYIDLGNHCDSEFTYVNDMGVSVEQINHTTHIVEAKELSKEQKETIIAELPFADKDMFSDLIYQKKYNVVFISILNDVNLGVYERNDSGELVAFTEAYYPLTDKKNWDGYINGGLWTAGCDFTEENLREFKEKYTFKGRNTEENVINNLKYIRDNLPDETLMVIMLGSEIPFEKNEFEAYKDRHILHKKYNDAVKQYSEHLDNVKVLDVNKYISGQESFYKHINHFIPKVYYEMAQDMVKLINDWTGTYVAKSNKAKELKGKIKYGIKKILGKM